MALQRLKLIVIENEKSETTEFASYKEIVNYASAKLGPTEEPADAKSSGPLRQSDSEASETKEEKKFLQNDLQEQVQEKAAEVEATPISEDGDKKFLENDLKTAIAERKQQSKKSSFWDKLK